MASLDGIAIIYIAGIRTHSYHTAGWRKTLAPYDATFIDSPRYMWWEHDVIKSIVDKTTVELRAKQEAIIIAHSFGGIIAQTALNQLDNTDHIKGLITLASPHRYNILGLSTAKERIGYCNEPMVPTKTYGGYLDPVVPFNTTSLNGQNHINILSEHTGFLFVPWIRQRVLDDAETLLSERLA